MRSVPIILFCCCAVMLAGCGPRTRTDPTLYTSNYRPPRDENFNGGPNAMLLKYDANHDGSLTRAELNAGLKAEFDKYDTNHTGCLDTGQVAAINAARLAEDKSTATPLEDWNQDGCIDLKEFSTAANSLFDQLDKNGDGTITPLEFNPRPAPRGGQIGEPQRRRGQGP